MPDGCHFEAESCGKTAKVTQPNGLKASLVSDLESPNKLVTPKSSMRFMSISDFLSALSVYPEPRIRTEGVTHE